MMRRFAPWALRVLLTLGFLPAGLTKILSPEPWVGRFAGWGYDPWFVPVVGALELAGLVLLWIPRATRYGIGLLGVIMLGAAVTHLLHPPQVAVLRPAVFLLVLSLLYLSTRRAQAGTLAGGS